MNHGKTATEDSIARSKWVLAQYKEINGDLYTGSKDETMIGDMIADLQIYVKEYLCGNWDDVESACIAASHGLRKEPFSFMVNPANRYAKVATVDSLRLFRRTQQIMFMEAVDRGCPWALLQTLNEARDFQDLQLCVCKATGCETESWKVAIAPLINAVTEPALPRVCGNCKLRQKCDNYTDELCGTKACDRFQEEK